MEKQSNLKIEEIPEKKPAIPSDLVLLSMPCFLSVRVHAAGSGVELSALQARVACGASHAVRRVG